MLKPGTVAGGPGRPRVPPAEVQPFGATGSDPSSLAHTENAATPACDGIECSQRAVACWTVVRGCGVVDFAYNLRA